MLSKQVKERILRNKMRRRLRFFAAVRVTESDQSHTALQDYQKELLGALPSGGYPRDQLVVFAAQGRVSRPLETSARDFFKEWTGGKPTADGHLARPGEFKRMIDDQLTLRQAAKAEFLNGRKEPNNPPE